jgi:hypothetical protein
MVRASPALILSPMCRSRRSHCSARGPVSLSRMKASASCTSSRVGVQSVTLDPVSLRCDIERRQLVGHLFTVIVCSRRTAPRRNRANTHPPLEHLAHAMVFDGASLARRADAWRNSFGENWKPVTVPPRRVRRSARFDRAGDRVIARVVRIVERRRSSARSRRILRVSRRWYSAPSVCHSLASLERRQQGACEARRATPFP